MYIYIYVCVCMYVCMYISIPRSFRRLQAPPARSSHGENPPAEAIYMYTYKCVYVLMYPYLCMHTYTFSLVPRAFRRRRVLHTDEVHRPLAFTRYSFVDSGIEH